MLKKFGLAAALALVAGFVEPPIGPNLSLLQAPRPSVSREARLEQQKSKWAPNGMKVLIIHGKRRWVEEPDWPPVEKSEINPILKEGV